MKRILLPALLAVALTSLTTARLSAADQDMTGGSVEKTITQLEQDWGVALVKADVAWINGITADDYTMTDPDGTVVTRAQGDADLKSGVMHFDSFTLDEVKVHVHGDTAVVFGLETEKSTYKGADSSGQYRFTDTFTKHDGKWIALATHVTRVVKH